MSSIFVPVNYSLTELRESPLVIQMTSHQPSPTILTIEKITAISDTLTLPAQN
jgi:hypothetical protein